MPIKGTYYRETLGPAPSPLTFAPGITGNALTAPSQIGTLINVFLSTNVSLGTSSPSATPNILYITNLPIGIWIVSYQLRYTNVGGTSNVTNLSSIVGVSSFYNSYAPYNNGWASCSISQSISSSSAFVLSSTFIFNNTSSTQILTLTDTSQWTGTGSLIVYGNGSSSGNTQSYLQAVRIA